MAGNNKYVFEVVSDWSQPERAVKQYAERAAAALKSIRAQGRQPTGGVRSPAQIKETKAGYVAQAETLGRQKGILRQERQAAIKSGDTARANEIDRALARVSKDISSLQGSVRRFAKSIGDAALPRNTVSAVQSGMAQVANSIRETAASKKREAKAAKDSAAAAESADKAKKRAEAKAVRELEAVAAASAKMAIQAQKRANREAKRNEEPIRKLRERADRDRRLSDPSDPLGQARAEADAARRALNAQRQEERDKANARAQRRAQTDELARQQAIGDPTSGAARAAAAQRRLANAIQIQALQNERAAIGSKENADAQYRIWRLSRENEKAQNRALINSIKNAEATGAAPRGTMWQQIVAARRNAQGIPTAEADAPTARESLLGGIGNRLKSSLQFAASGALIYGGQKFIRETITEASELQSTLSLLQGQFEAAGQTGEVSFQQVKESIIETANQTGIMATQVAEIERRLMGIFRQQNAAGEDTGPDFGAAEEATRISAQLAQITGLDVKTITDELVAVYKSFEGSLNEISFAALSDHLVTVAQSAGVTEKELLEMTSSLSPLANQLGFTAQQLLGFSAAAISSSGRSASTLGENFGRVLTDLGSKQQQIIEFYQQIPSLEGKIPELQTMFAEGDIQGVLRSFVGDWDEMSQTVRGQFAESVFGKREAQSIVSILNQGTRTLELADMEEDPRATEDRLRRRQETVQYAIDTMERKFEEFGDALYAAGIGDAIKTLLAGLSGFAEIGTSVAKVLGTINEAMEGMPGYLLGAAAAWKVYSVAVSRATASQMFGGAGALVLPGRRAAGAPSLAAGGFTGASGRFAPGSRFSPYLAGATPLNSFRGVSGYGGFKPGVNTALGGRFGGAARAGLGVGGAGAAGVGALAAAAPMVAVMGAFIAVGVLQSRRDKWIEEVNLIAQEEEQLIRQRSEEGKTEQEIRDEIGEGAPLPDRGALDRGYNNISTGFSAAIRSVGAVAAAPFDIFGEGLSGFRERAGDIQEDTANRLRDPRDIERERVFDEIERDNRRAILGLFDGKGKKERERREEILKNLSGDADEEYLREVIQKYLDDPTDEDAKAAVEQIIGAAAMNDVVGPLVEAEQEKSAAEKEWADNVASTTSDDTMANIEMLRREVDTGGAGRDALLAVLRKNLSIYRNGLQAAQQNGSNEQIREALRLVVEAETEITELLLARFETPVYDEVSDLVSGGDPATAIARGQERLAELRAATGPSQAVQDAQAEVDRLTGGGGGYSAAGTGSADALNAAQERLREAQDLDQGVVTEESIQAQYEIVQGIVEAKQAELEALIGATENIQEKDRLRQQGIDLTEAERVALFMPQLMEGDNPERIDILAENLGKSREEIWAMIRDSILMGDETVEEGLVAAADLATANYEGVLRMIEAAGGPGASDALGQARAAMDAANANLEAFRGVQGDVVAPGTTVGPTDKATFDAERRQKEVDTERERARQAIERRKILAEGDPQALARLALESAQLDLAIAKQIGDDAQIAQAETAVLAAQAGIDAADRQVANALAKENIARKEIMARNDPVALAHLAKESALLDLEIAKATGDKAAIAAALTAVMSADAAIVDAQRELDKSRVQGQAAIAAANANGDPLAAARASQWEANALRGLAIGEEIPGAIAAQIEAANRVQEAMDDIQRAQIEYSQARAFGDPVRQAQLGLQLANYNVATAKGEADRLRALIGQMDAQRALQQAIVDVFNAWNDVAVAQREAAGDTIGAAQLELQRIKKNLDAARRQGDNMKVLELTAAQIRAEASLRDTTLTERQGDIDFALQMQKITTAQAISQLELLLQIPNLTKNQIQDLQLKIKSLRDELGRDYQFNLPTELGLPTLYEVRRMNQSGGDYQAGRGGAPATQVQDNRTYDISITASGVDAKDALRVVTEAIQAPATTGTRGLGY